MTRPVPQRMRRAFATIAALSLVAVVGVTLAALTTYVARDLKRTTQQAQDAQLRQLLTAGEAAVRTSLDKGGRPQDVSLKLPAELESAGMSLTFEPVESTSADTVRVRVIARGGEGRSASQTLNYARAADHWELRGADL